MSDKQLRQYKNSLELYYALLVSTPPPDSGVTTKALNDTVMRNLEVQFRYEQIVENAFVQDLSILQPSKDNLLPLCICISALLRTIGGWLGEQRLYRQRYLELLKQVRCKTSARK